MSIDVSRNSYRPERDYAAVVTQQGRVRLDADDNEQAAIVDRRLRVLALDLGGRAIAPASTPGAFAITVSDGQPSIGAGRLYVDGLLAENRGGGAASFDPALEELHAAAPLRYDAQPWLPSAPAVPQGRYLAYLDVWRRPVTYVQEPDLVEKAVGVDTAARMQTVWQVRLAPIAAATCAALATDPTWLDLARAPAARLTTATSASLPATDPCQAPAAGGYRGLENQLYRVEIHDGGSQGQATFKWSRDNASVESAVRGIDPGRTRITLDSLGRDDRLGFGDGDWVEVTDEARALAGLAGAMARVATGGTEAATRTLTLVAALPDGWFPTDAAGATAPERRTLVRRWDQAGKVLRGDGQVYADLDAGGATGAIALPAAGTTVALEDGITVAFGLAPGGGVYRPGDHWIFAARAADASIELLDHAVPAGPHHHLAPLALVSPDGIQDCRTPWPPAGEGGCTCIGVPAGFDLAALPALLPADRQVHLCLAAGEFRIGAAVVLDGGAGKGARGALRLTGAGPATRIVAAGEAGLVLTGWDHATVEQLAVATGTTEHLHQNGVGIVGGITAIDCGAVSLASIVATAAGGFPAACLRVAAIEGSVDSVRIAGCTLSAGAAVSAILVTGAARSVIVDNRVGAVAPAALPIERLERVRARQAIRGGDGLIGMPEMLVGDAAPRRTKTPPGQKRALVRSGKVAVAFTTPEVLADAWAAWYAAEPPARSLASGVLLLRDLQKRAARMIAQRGDVAGVPAFAAWYNNTRKDVPAPAAGIVVAGALAASVRIAGNDVAGARCGIRVALSHHAARTVRDSIGRVVIADNLVTATTRGRDAARAIGIMTGSSAGTTIAGNTLSGGRADGSRSLEAIRLFGDLGRFAIVRENRIDGFETGIRMVSLVAKPDRPLWRIADNLAEGAGTPVVAPALTTLANNHA